MGSCIAGSRRQALGASSIVDFELWDFRFGVVGGVLCRYAQPLTTVVLTCLKVATVLAVIGPLVGRD